MSLRGARLPRRRSLAALVAGGLASLGVVPAAATPPTRATWTVSWATSQHTTGPALQDQSVRMIVHLTQGGDALRVRIGNTLGTTPLRVGSASAGIRTTGPAVQGTSLRPLTFSGARTVDIPAGQYVVSDAIELPTAAGQDVAVSIYVPGAAVPSAHGTAFETSYLTPASAGDRTREAAGSSYSQTTTSYLMVDAVDVRSTQLAGAIVVVGGSVVDGTGSDRTGPLGTGPAAPPNSRWSDVLARRITREVPLGARLTVAQAGIGGNTASRECVQGGSATPYSNVQDRLDRDVLSLSNVTHLLLYAGTNDLGIGTGCDAEQIIKAYRDILRRAAQHGVRTVIATVTPRAHYTPVQNEARQLVNLWITRQNSCGGECDGTADFDAAIRFYAYPNAIDPRYDSGDDIHPNAEGYALMGEAVDVRQFRER